MIYKAVILWYFAINIVLFILMGIDKYRAVHKKWRIPEATLLISSCLGGFVGGFLGMHLFHHKSKKIYFHIIFWLSALLHILLIINLLLK